MSKEITAQENKEEKGAGRSGFIDEKLFKSRSLTLFGEINDKIARSVTERLLALSVEGDDPIHLYISSPGGHVESGDVVYDMIKFIKPTVKVIGTGWVASAATTIYLAAEKENRFALPNTRFLIHQPLGGSRGDATDIAIQAEQIIKTRARINQLIADETGQDLERVAKDTDRDYWMSVDEAIDYGIVNKMVKSVAEI
ncbi:MAG: ATP-dependent Clp protease proteolytic subunit [Gammaproteobacteria bacterium]|nr:ATP-dependent Clp protease proteolytic subunit [Gammaproteobacteria bacterium]MDD9957667.1 ATP-dependent Clp protease proteolytic subunit [Gammaproteobacteria bacterium]